MARSQGSGAAPYAHEPGLFGGGAGAGASISRRVLALTRPPFLLAAGALALALAAPDPAQAAEKQPSNTGSTLVTVEADKGNLSFEVPTVIPFAAAADGSLTGPSPDATRITNRSAFGIHVVRAAVAQEKPWALVKDAKGSEKPDSIAFAVGPEGTQAFSASEAGGEGTDLSAHAGYDMAASGSEGDSIALATSGSVSRITTPLAQAAKVGTITWTVEAGRHAGA